MRACNSSSVAAALVFACVSLLSALLCSLPASLSPLGRFVSFFRIQALQAVEKKTFHPLFRTDGSEGNQQSKGECCVPRTVSDTRMHAHRNTLSSQSAREAM